MHLVIQEGPEWADLAPLTLGRPAFALACGASTLLEKQLRVFRPTQLTLRVREELAEWVRRRLAPKTGVPTLVNPPSAIEANTTIPAASLCIGKGASPKPIGRIWDLITHSQGAIEDDFQHLGRLAPAAGPYHVVNPEQIHVDPSVRIQPGVVLDASNGPIIIGASATIGANAVLQGPCCIGPDSIVNTLSTIRPGTSIGPLCKVGGEVSNSTLLGYSNKAHEGFLGDSYVGQWVNLGAATTTSNLKNTYGEISANTAKGPVRTGRQFLGSIIADHVKTAIGTRMMAGTTIGYSAMLALSSIAPKFVRSFSFLTDNGSEEYRLEKAMEVMKAVYGRRRQVWDEAEEAVVRYVRSMTREIEPVG